MVRQTGHPTSLDLSHEPVRHRFVARVSGTEAVIEYRGMNPAMLDFHHTFVPQALRGTGIAAELTTFALDHARANGLKVRPTCPYTARFIERHPEYASLVG